MCALSLKDLCLVPYLAELAQDGVASLKIEGRCKRPEYVAAAVTALVQARAGEEPDLDTLRAVFSRSGFTDGYYNGKRQQMLRHRQKEDVLQAKEVLPHLAQLYQKPTPQIALTMDVRVQTGEPAVLTLRDADGNCVTVSGETVQPARTKTTDAAQLERQLGKLGGTIYALAELHAELRRRGNAPGICLERTATGRHRCNGCKANCRQHAALYHTACHPVQRTDLRHKTAPVPHHAAGLERAFRTAAG